MLLSRKTKLPCRELRCWVKTRKAQARLVAAKTGKEKDGKKALRLMKSAGVPTDFRGDKKRIFTAGRKS